MPEVEPESLVPVARFHGSRLASGPSPSPYQQGFRSDQKLRSGNSHDSHTHNHATKVARLASAATVGAAIVEAENSLEIEVCFPASGEAV